ncbi:MAG: mannose-6-phosphate isomerase, class I [Bacteroidota bacterium]|nr:mannose-6-phosphate isomerase, class I [Bacteroidota bacterium]
MIAERKIFRLKGKTQHYNWGGIDFIPLLLGIENSSRLPFAEYWLGAHDTAPSEVEINEIEFISLNKLVNANPELLLGKDVAKQFKRLPYLLKVLDVKDMLSIQVHPSKLDAEKEFARENAELIPLNASNRNYKDDNHKPELMVALSDFWLLHGFKSSEKLTAILHANPELKTLLPVFEQSGYKGLYKYVMEMPQEEVYNMLQPLLNRIIPLYKQDTIKKEEEDFWAAGAAITFNETGKIDRGIFSIYLFNLVHLKKGEGIYQAAGVPHAYLEGQNVEIMANSDNVLRGGLTTKHIDVGELMKHVKCEALQPGIIYPGFTSGKNSYKTPAIDFELNYFALAAGEKFSFSSNSAEIILVMNGEIVVKQNETSIPLHKGQSIVVFDGAKAEVVARQDSQWYSASVPVNKDE